MDLVLDVFNEKKESLPFEERMLQDNELFNHLLHDFLCWIISFSLVRDMPIIVGFLSA